MTDDRTEVLKTLTLGQRVAEEEASELATYFVETDQWQKVLDGKVDIVFGPKGAGKSAIYSTLISREDFLFDEGVLVITAEKPQGTPAFEGLATDPPTGEQEFIGLWKLYILSLIGSTLVEYDIQGADSKLVQKFVTREGLLPAKDAPLSTRLALVYDYIRKKFRLGSLEAGLNFDPATGSPAGVQGKITFQEPSPKEATEGSRSTDFLLQAASNALKAAELEAWILFDRLDVAFANSRELEGNALRALCRAYLDMGSIDRIKLKIFLRSDIWKSITESGLRESSHITKQMTISWSEPAILNLVVRRLVNNEALMKYMDVSSNEGSENDRGSTNFL